MSDADDDDRAEEAEATDDASEPAPKKKPKRKKRKKKAKAEDELGAALDSEGRERPVFLLAFPDEPELNRLVAAFEAGNYALVRSDAPKLAENTDREDVREAALELRRRIDPDPLARFIIGVSVVLLAFLTAWAYLGHDH